MINASKLCLSRGQILGECTVAIRNSGGAAGKEPADQSDGIGARVNDGGGVCLRNPANCHQDYVADCLSNSAQTLETYDGIRVDLRTSLEDWTNRDVVNRKARGGDRLPDVVSGATDHRIVAQQFSGNCWWKVILPEMDPGSLEGKGHVNAVVDVQPQASFGCDGQSGLSLVVEVDRGKFLFAQLHELSTAVSEQHHLFRM